MHISAHVGICDDVMTELLSPDDSSTVLLMAPSNADIVDITVTIIIATEWTETPSLREIHDAASAADDSVLITVIVTAIKKYGTFPVYSVVGI